MSKVGHDAQEQPTTREIAFESDGLRIVGYLIGVTAARAAALVLSGSGRVDRDSNVERPHLPLGIAKAIAESLEAVQVSTLRYDKRGVGQSQGDFLTTSLTGNYSDARTGLRRLADHCPDRPLFAIGHSEGAVHAARLAAEKTGGRRRAVVHVEPQGRGGPHVASPGYLCHAASCRQRLAGITSIHMTDDGGYLSDARHRQRARPQEAHRGGRTPSPPRAESTHRLPIFRFGLVRMTTGLGRAPLP
jgi:pimeloyl-ACP methyl ester carboxylesterase